MQSNPWRKAPEDLQERFAAAAAGIDGMEQRQMFGYPAGFIGGNLTTSLHQESWIVRLPDAERQERLDAGWSVFEPMRAGRCVGTSPSPTRSRPIRIRRGPGSNARRPTSGPCRRRCRSRRSRRRRRPERRGAGVGLLDGAGDGHRRRLHALTRPCRAGSLVLGAPRRRRLQRGGRCRPGGSPRGRPSGRPSRPIPTTSGAPSRPG